MFRSEQGVRAFYKGFGANVPKAFGYTIIIKIFDTYSGFKKAH